MASGLPTNAAMTAQINAGLAVTYRGQLITTLAGLPTDQQIAQDASQQLTTLPLLASVQRVSAGLAAPGQSIKTFNFKQATSASLITTISFYTVAIGKTFALTDVAIYSDGATLCPDVQVQAAGTVIFRGNVRDISPIQMPGIESQATATSGQALTLVIPIMASTPNISGIICGVEQ